MKINYAVYRYISMPGLTQTEVVRCIKLAEQEFTKICNLQWWMVASKWRIMIATKNTTAYAGAAYWKSQANGTIYLASNPAVNWIKKARQGPRDAYCRTLTGLCVHELCHMVADRANYRNETGGLPFNAFWLKLLVKLYKPPVARDAAPSLDEMTEDAAVVYGSQSLLYGLRDWWNPGDEIITPADWEPPQ